MALLGTLDVIKETVTIKTRDNQLQRLGLYGSLKCSIPSKMSVHVMDIHFI